MNKLFKTLSIVVLVVMVAVMVVQARQQASASPARLPHGLTLQDTMASVEQKLGHPKVEHAPQAGWAPGLPDVGFTTDYIHYWAVYDRFGVTVIYNSPSASDKNATIYYIIVDD
jgi:hypothetical protein